MFSRIAMIALGAVCCIFSGCGCSKEKGEETAVPSRMEDAAYTNRLVEIQKSRNAVAAKAAALRVKIKDLGPDAVGTPEFVDLTNQLAKCVGDSEKMRKTALNVIRSRVVKEADVKKGDLKK